MKGLKTRGRYIFGRIWHNAEEEDGFIFTQACPVEALRTLSVCM